MPNLIWLVAAGLVVGGIVLIVPKARRRHIVGLFAASMITVCTAGIYEIARRAFGGF